MPNVPVYIMCGSCYRDHGDHQIFTAWSRVIMVEPVSDRSRQWWYSSESHDRDLSLMSPNMYLFNLELFNSLDADTQQLITAAADKSSRHAWNTSVEEEKTVKQELEGHGMEIIIPDESFRTDLHAAMDGVYAQLEQEFDWAGEQIEIAKSYA